MVTVKFLWVSLCNWHEMMLAKVRCSSLHLFFLCLCSYYMCIDVQNTRSMYMSLRHTSYFVMNSEEDHTQVIKVFIDRYIGHVAVITDKI